MDVSSRLRCRHCRFEKCKAMGMVYESEDSEVESWNYNSTFSEKKKVEEAEIRQVPNHRAHYQDQVQAQEQYVLEVHDLPVHWVLEEYQDFVAEEDLFDPEPEEEDPDLQEYMFGEVQEVIAFANTCQVFRSMTNLTKVCLTLSLNISPDFSVNISSINGPNWCSLDSWKKDSKALEG